jgi:hypothetical protein
LCLDAVEISTTGGHYAGLGLPRTPFPLAGDPAGVVEDVRRLGGFGIVTHPDSAKRSLRWREWDLPVDGFEWLNADSEWRDESRRTLIDAVLHYMARQPETLASLLDRPDTTLRRWDALGGQGRRLVALAGADAHARIGPRGTPDDAGEGENADEAWSLPLPSYEAVFRSFSTRVALDRSLTGDAESDADAVLHAIRAGRVFTVVDGIASPGAFEFYADSARGIARMGDVLPPGARPLGLRARSAAPHGAELRLFRNGTVVARSTGVELSFDAPEPVDSEPEMYRVEVGIPGAPGEPSVPWIVSNAIYVSGRPASSDEASDRPRSAGERGGPPRNRASALRPNRWVPEHSPGSLVSLDVPAAGGAGALAFTFRLDSDSPNAFAAIAHRLKGTAGEGAVRLRARADRPLRISVQLRLSDAEHDLRWSRSVYLDTHRREVEIPMATMQPVARTVGESRRSRADSLLLVVDRTNSAAGATGTVWVDAAAIVGILRGSSPNRQ